MKKGLVSLAVLLGSFSAVAQVAPTENYTPSTINENMTSEVWSSMKTSFKSGSECFNRALSWNYDLDKQFGIKSKKILIHYSYKFNKELSAKWGFHIAPVINVEGTDTVFDKGFTPWLYSPLSKKMWEEKFLIAGTEKLVEKRIEFKKDLKEKIQDLRELDRSSESYYDRRNRINAKIREIKEKMAYFRVTDAELEEQRPKKIAMLKNAIAFHEDSLLKLEEGSRSYKSAMFQIKYNTKLLIKVEKDLNYAPYIQCKKISNIEELDFNPTEEWCFVQETSMYYWGVPQLRLLNYGQTSRPYKNELSSKRRAGRNYVQDKFSMEQIWIARKQAFGSDYKEIWKKEYDAKENAKDQAKADKRRAKKEAKEERRRQRERRRAQRRSNRN